jgi:predicted nuclease of predicted toxin-antitoxin system
MKFVVDAQLPPALGAWFRTKGHEALLVRDIALRDAEDLEIWRYAAREAATIVTKDEDFVYLASLRTGPVVVWVRCGNLVNRLLLARFDACWPELMAHLEGGIRLVEVR